MSTSLTDPDHRLSTLEDLYRWELLPKVESMARNLSQTNSDVKTAHREVFKWHSALATAQILITSLEETIRTQARDFGYQISALNAGTTRDVHSLRDEVRREFNRINSQLSRLSTQLDRVLIRAGSGQSGGE